MKIKFRVQSNRCYMFNYSSGKSIDLQKENMVISDSLPNLLDVSITNRCNKGCSFCYRESKTTGEDMSLDDYRLVLKKAIECGVQQIAIGGGEPTLHPDFCRILRLTRESGIIPNYSTNGDNLSQNILTHTKKLCGAVALSIYDDIFKYTDIINEIVDKKIKLNLHFILRSDKIDEYIYLLNHHSHLFLNINAIVFLNYKPANGDYSLCFNRVSEDNIRLFFETIESFKTCSVGFDTCSATYIQKYLTIDNSLYNFCEAGRNSAFINEKLYVLPCSFYKSGGLSLKTYSLKDIWMLSSDMITNREIWVREKENGKSEYDYFGCPIYDINVCST